METLEERMLNAFAKLSASKGEGAATFNFKTAAKACAKIAEDFAKQKAEAFAKWIRENDFEWSVKGYWFNADPIDQKQYADTDLFELFNKQP